MATLYLFEMKDDLLKVSKEMEELSKQNKLEKHDLFLNQNYPFIQESLYKKDHTGLHALLMLDRLIYVPLNTFYIGSKLEMGDKSKSCRLSFHGRILQKSKIEKSLSEIGVELESVKYRSGTLERFVNNSTIIVKDLFSKG